VTVQSAITAAVPPGSTLQTLTTRRALFKVAEYHEDVMVLLLGHQNRRRILWQDLEELGAWLAARGWTALGAGYGVPTSPESLNGFLDGEISRSAGSYVAAILAKAGLVETDGRRPLRIRWLAAPGGTRKDEDHRASRWADAEIKPTVTAYFTMLRAELAGQRYVKADLNREVQAATGRSRGAVEYKFANISAVLRDIGLPHVLGYQPRANYQSVLRAEVERSLDRDPEIPRLLEEMPAPDLPSTLQLVEVDPPVMAPPRTRGRGRTTVGIDYLERQARNRDVGLKGELLVVEHERAWLSAHGHPDLAELVTHVPSTLGDGAGYDVSSFSLDGSPHHIEVKATRGSITAPFFLSASELDHALERPETYSIYRVFDLVPNPRFYKLTGDMEEILDLTPVSYQARVKGSGARSTAHS
jgi:hypothetical protein